MEDKFDSEATGSIRSLFELFTRIDERSRSTIESIERLEHKMEDMLQVQNKLMNRISIMEDKDNSGSIKELESGQSELDKQVMMLEVGINRNRTLWEKVIDYIMKILVAAAAAYVIWKFGLR